MKGVQLNVSYFYLFLSNLNLDVQPGSYNSLIDVSYREGDFQLQKILLSIVKVGTYRDRNEGKRFHITKSSKSEDVTSLNELPG